MFFHSEDLRLLCCLTNLGCYPAQSNPCRPFQVWPAVFCDRLEESGLDEDVVEWLGRETRGGLLYPRQPLYSLFEELTASLASATVATATSDAFWAAFQRPLSSLLEELLRPEQPDEASSPFLAGFCSLILAVFRRVYVRGLARSKRDQLQDGHMSLAHLAGPTPKTGPDEEEEEDSEQPLDFQAIQAIPAGSHRPLREDLHQRAMLRLDHNPDGNQ